MPPARRSRRNRGDDPEHIRADPKVRRTPPSPAPHHTHACHPLMPPRVTLSCVHARRHTAQSCSNINPDDDPVCARVYVRVRAWFPHPSKRVDCLLVTAHALARVPCLYVRWSDGSVEYQVFRDTKEGKEYRRKRGEAWTAGDNDYNYGDFLAVS
jgi:hypothetical protein